MQLTKLFSFITAMLLITVISAGCASTNTYPVQPTSSHAAAGAQDTFLAAFVAADHNYTARNVTIKTWETRWLNDTTVNVEATGALKANNTTMHSNRTLTRFSSIKAATTYVGRQNLSGYVVTQAANESANVYKLATRNPPTVFKAYRRTSQSANNVTTAEVTQCDAIVVTGITTLTAGRVVATPRPSSSPSPVPTPLPTPVPTTVPTFTPTEVPTFTPTEVPTAAPTTVPTAAPTTVPTAAPTTVPTPTDIVE
ncbi:MAG: hypothetical protein ABR979_01735 [Halobacteriota archaeon]